MGFAHSDKLTANDRWYFFRVPPIVKRGYMKINFDKYDGSNRDNIWRVPISNYDETRKYTIVFEMENSNSQKIKKMYLEDLDENMKAFSRGGEAVNATIKQMFDLFEKRS